MYKKASQLKLRFETAKGLLSVEQLWDLNLADLSDAIKKVKSVLKKDDDDELSFLEDGKKIDSENELRFEIMKDVYLTRKKQQEDALSELEKKEHNQKILGIIADKTDDELRSKSVEELQAMVRK